MRKSFFAPSVIVWALAAVLAIALPGVPSVCAATSATPDAATTQLNAQLAAQFPAHPSILKASVGEIGLAVGKLAAADPAVAAKVTQAALASKRHNDRSKTKLFRSEVKTIVRAALDAAPSMASDIIAAAISEYPEYANDLNDMISKEYQNSTNAPTGFDTPQDLYGGFGVGFGPGFPGSPGFSGSSPSGAIAFPNGSLTSVVNG